MERAKQRTALTRVSSPRFAEGFGDAVGVFLFIVIMLIAGVKNTLDAKKRAQEQQKQPKLRPEDLPPEARRKIYGTGAPPVAREVKPKGETVVPIPVAQRGAPQRRPVPRQAPPRRPVPPPRQIQAPQRPAPRPVSRPQVGEEVDVQAEVLRQRQQEMARRAAEAMARQAAEREQAAREEAARRAAARGPVALPRAPRPKRPAPRPKHPAPPKPAPAPAAVQRQVQAPAPAPPTRRKRGEFLQSLLGSRAAQRRAIILSEALGPPVSMRPGFPGRG